MVCLALDVNIPVKRWNEEETFTCFNSPNELRTPTVELCQFHSRRVDWHSACTIEAHCRTAGSTVRCKICLWRRTSCGVILQFERLEDRIACQPDNRQ
jgi:hypothetical protein